MDDGEFLARRFEEHRTHLRAVAYRLLGSTTEAEDAVQEAWLRLARSDTSEVANLGGWLTTVVARVSLNMLRSRSTRREQPLDDSAPEPAGGVDPEQEAVVADSVGLALLVVLDTLSPAERLAFVLHDLFAVPFEEVAEILDRSPTAARQLASRARRRVRGANPPDEPDIPRQREIVDAFLAASRGGDFEGLLTLLDPNVVLHADELAVRMAKAQEKAGAPPLAPELRGAETVAATFFGRAHAAQPALINGSVGAVWAPRGRPLGVFMFEFTGDRITGVDLVSNREDLDALDLEILPA